MSLQSNTEPIITDETGQGIVDAIGRLITTRSTSGTDNFFWTDESQVSNGSISFSGIDDTDGNAYDLYIYVDSTSTEKNPSSEIESISGTGTNNMNITFSTTADNGAYGKLRVLT